jgi:hypothetical protein
MGPAREAGGDAGGTAPGAVPAGAPAPGAPDEQEAPA